MDGQYDRGEKRIYSIMRWIQHNSKVISILLFIVSIGFAGAGLYFVYIFADNTITVNSYTPTEAIVDYVKENRTYSSGKNLRSVSSANNVIAHYEVNGEEYSIHVQGFGVNERRLTKGDTITVYYDPSNPSNAVVKASTGFFAIGFFFIILFSVLAASLTKKG